MSGGLHLPRDRDDRTGVLGRDDVNGNKVHEGVRPGLSTSVRLHVGQEPTQRGPGKKSDQGFPLHLREMSSTLS